MRRAAGRALLAALLGLLLPGCPPGTGDNACIKARAKLCGEGSPMREGGICQRLRADGDHPDADLAKKCALLLKE